MDPVDVRFGADAAGLEAGTKEATAAIDTATSAWQEKFQATFASINQSVHTMGTAVTEQAAASTEKMELFAGAINKVHKAFMLIGEVAMLGWIGDKIYELVEKTADWAEELEHAREKVGMNTTALQGLSIAATLYGSSSDGVLRAMRQLSTSIMYAKEGMTTYTRSFDALGVSMEELKDKSPEQVLMRVANAFRDHADGIGKAALAQQLFGRSGQELIPLFNSGADGIQRIMEKAQQMGAVMSTQDVAAASELKEQMEWLDVGMEGVHQRIALKLMPAFQGLIHAFSESTKTGGQMDQMLSLISGGMNFLAKSVSYVAEAFEVLGKQIAGVAAATVELAHLHFKNASEIEKMTTKDVNDAVAAAEKFRESLNKPFKVGKMELPKMEEKGETAKPDFSFSPTTGKGTGKSQVQEWQEALEEKKMLSSKYLADDKEQDLKYWESKLALTKKGSSEWLAVTRQTYQLKKGIAQDDFDAQMSTLRSETMQAEAGSLERIQIARQESQLIGQTYGLRSKQYLQSVQAIEKAEKDHAEQEAKNAKASAEAQIAHVQQTATLELELQRAKLERAKSLDQITDAQFAQAEVKLENEKYAIDVAALQKKEALYKDDVKAFQQAQNQMQALALKHQIALEKIIAPKKNPYAHIFDAMNKDMDQVVVGVLRGNTKMVNTLRNLWNGMVLDWAHAGIKMVTAAIQHEVAITAAHQAGNQANLASDNESQSQGLAMTVMTNLKKITSFAATAAAGAYQAMASIPYIGPVLGAVAAAATFAGVMAFGAMASAAGGYDIPTGVNPVTQLHQQEMVLPAHIANPLRQMVAGGGTGGAMSVNVTAMDARSVQQFFSGNGGRTLANSLARQARNFNGAFNVG